MQWTEQVNQLQEFFSDLDWKLNIVFVFVVFLLIIDIFSFALIQSWRSRDRCFLQYCLKGPLLMVQQAFQVPEHFNIYFFCNLKLFLIHFYIDFVLHCKCFLMKSDILLISQCHEFDNLPDSTRITKLIKSTDVFFHIWLAIVLDDKSGWKHDQIIFKL